MFKRLLVPLDGSSPSDYAFDFALEMLQGRDGEIAVCVCVNPDAFAPWLTSVMADAQRLVEHAKQSASERGVPCSGDVVLNPSAANAIIAIAQERGADAIVTGTHGRSGFARRVMGSVSEAVLRGAGCAVVAVRAPRLQPQAFADRPARHADLVGKADQPE